MTSPIKEHTKEHIEKIMKELEDKYEYVFDEIDESEEAINYIWQKAQDEILDEWIDWIEGKKEQAKEFIEQGHDIDFPDKFVLMCNKRLKELRNRKEKLIWQIKTATNVTTTTTATTATTSATPATATTATTSATPATATTATTVTTVLCALILKAQKKNH